MTFHDNLPYLKHIIDAIGDIENSIAHLSQKQFMKNKDVKDATVRRIEIMGEAVKHLSPELRRSYLEVPWKRIAGSRDIMIHAYFSVDFEVVWNIVKKDIPLLKEQLLRILKAEEHKK